jgi:hypothetical protein
MTRAKLWDPIWFFFHETLSFLLWLGIGVSIDSGLIRIKKTMVAYFVTRFWVCSSSSRRCRLAC